MATVASTAKKSPAAAVPLIASNTRKIGRKYEVDLQKGGQGLGFSITTRDNPAGGNCPIYVKNILPQGAAIDDGRLRPGDRLLEVNGIEVTGKTQAEAVAILKNIPLGGIVKLIVSRQERVDLSPKLPRQIPPEKVMDDSDPVPWSEKEILEFDIPVLDTEKAGLGISVKGKTGQLEGAMRDMGIFIKSVIHGGAASRDGRVKSNDQLLSVNGVSLLNCSNTQAMETLRRTMTMDQGPKPKPGYITLTVARRAEGKGSLSGSSGDEMMDTSWTSRGHPSNASFSVDGPIDTRPQLQHPSFVMPQSQYQGQGTLTFPVRQFSPEPDYHGQVTVQSQNQTPIGQGQISQFRGSSLRRVDLLKGKFEGLLAEQSQNQSQNVPQQQHHQQVNLPKAPLDLPRNPVLERLTGKGQHQPPGVPGRNESYFRATADLSFSPGQMQMQQGQGGNGNGEVMIEDDYSAPQKPPRRSRSSTPEDSLDSRGYRAERNQNQGQMMVMHQPQQQQPVPISSPGSEAPALSDVTYASQTSLEDAGGFSRDAFGRQSMSEKRHATLDAKSTDTYQRNRKLKEERERIRQEERERLKAQRLAEDKNLQDEWARRGVKRPLPSEEDPDQDQEDDVRSQGQSQKSPSLSVAASSMSPNATPPWREQIKAKGYLRKGRPGDRLGLGDQLLQLLQHWGQKRSLPRVNSADSLVEALKLSSSPRRDKGGHRSSQGQGGHGRGHYGQSPSRSSKSSRKERDIGPALGMKKSSSLESLQTMVQEIVIEEDMRSGVVPARSGSQTVRVVRGRGCNESFRQAVDRSYEAPLVGMDPLAEEETESCLSGAGGGGFDDARALSLKKKKEGKGLFRGLGSMFRFGRHRKVGKSPTGDWPEGQGVMIDPIQEQYRRLAEKRDFKGQGHGQGSSGQGHGNEYQDGRELRREGGSLRHGRSSKDLNGNPSGKNANANVPAGAHGRSQSQSYDVYNELMTRPGSRVGFAVADPKKYSHYLNYDEIKQHLNVPDVNGNGGGQGLSDLQLRQMRNTVVEQRKKAILESRRHQQHYHSQRRENPRDRNDRPVSNFYEYESVQAAMHAQMSQQQQQNQSQGQGRYQSPPRQVQGQGHPMQNPNQQNQNFLQQSWMNNNGITLPSPTVPLSLNNHSTGSLRQSPSQFHAMTYQLPQGQGQGQGRQGQNSLPRRHKKEPVPIILSQNPPLVGYSSTTSRPSLSQQFNGSGRYIIGPSSTYQQMSQANLQQHPQGFSNSRDHYGTTSGSGSGHGQGRVGQSQVSVGSKV